MRLFIANQIEMKNHIMQCQVEREAVTNWTEISAAESLAGLKFEHDKDMFICVLIFVRYKYVIDLYRFVNFHISLICFRI